MRELRVIDNQQLRLGVTMELQSPYMTNSNIDNGLIISIVLLSLLLLSLSLIFFYIK